MWILRALSIICLSATIAVVCYGFVGGSLWGWLFGAWLLSGPLIVLDVALSSGKSHADHEVTPRYSKSGASFSGASFSVSASQAEQQKLARSHEHNSDIFP